MSCPVRTLVLVVLALAVLLPGKSVAALGLKVAPLEYKTSLKSNEVKKGFIDVSNPSSQSMKVSVSVQAFRQIDNTGGLEFYEDKQIQLGISPELSTFELGPRAAIRLYFAADSNRLPTGDVFAAIFFTTEPVQPRSGVGQLVRVGTLLSIVNKSPGERKAEITGVSVPFLQFDDTVHGSYSIKNTGSQSSGFFPTVTVSSWPSGNTQKKDSSLVFGGNERSNDFTYLAGYGIHHIRVGFGSSQKSQWVVTAAPWMVVGGVIVLMVIASELLLLKKRRAPRPVVGSTTPDE